MPKDRHKDDQKFQCWLQQDEIARFDRLRPDKTTDKQALLKLMEIAEQTKKTDKDTIIDKLLEDAKNQISPEEAKTLRSKIETLELNEKKLKRALEDERKKELQKQPQSKVEYKEVIKEVPKIEYRDRIVEKPIYKGEKIVEKPVEKIVEKVIYIDSDDWLPEYWPFDSQEEHDKWFNS